MTTMVWAHLGYLAISVTVTAGVARTLRRHGPVFMAGDHETSPLVKAKTHLLVVGFYLINLGMIGLVLKYGGVATNAETAIELLSTKVGGIVFGIGFMHFLMVAMFASARKSEVDAKRTEILMAERVARTSAL